MVCAVLLSATYLALTVERGLPAQQPTAGGLKGAPVETEPSGGFCRGTQTLEADALLPRERDTNPFLLALALRSASCPPPCGGAFSGIRRPPPRAPGQRTAPASHPLLARNAQLLC